METSIARRIGELAEERPDEDVLCHVSADGTDTTWTWSALHRRSSQVAGALAERGLCVGDRLGIGLRNSPELVLATLAAWKLGAVPVPMRWDLPEWELGRLRETIGGKVHVGEDDLAWIAGTADDPVPDLPDVVSPQVNGICSSGSTGLPKIIVRNQPGYVERITIPPIAESWGATVPRPQVVLVPGPMYHVNGFYGFYTLLDGDHLVVMEAFDAARVVDVIERRRVSTFNCTPTMLKRMADVPGIDDRDLSSIVSITQGAAPMPPALVHRWAGLIGPERLLLAYGMTEGLGITAIRADEWMERPGSVGRPVRETEIKIVDPDGAVLPTGEIGEIHMRSDTSSALTYLGGAKPSLSPDGFGTVGDLGYLDEDGFLYLVDRRVDLIISGGANVYPAEVEMALIDHPKVADIVVIGLKDDEWGRRVHAVIQPHDQADPPSLDEVRAYAKSRLAPYKVPKSVEVVDVIPRSAATKVNRGALVAERGG